jgi:hypothetical protein
LKSSDPVAPVWCAGGSSSVTLLTPHPFWDHLLRCQPAIAHGMFDLGSMQTDVGQSSFIKLLERSGGTPQIQLVSRAAYEFPKIPHTISERGREIDCGTLQTMSH